VHAEAAAMEKTQEETRHSQHHHLDESEQGDDAQTHAVNRTMDGDECIDYWPVTAK